MDREFAYMREAMLPAGSVREKLERYLAASSELYGVSLLSEDGRTIFEWNPNDIFPAASSVKVHLGVALLRKVQDGLLSLDQVHTLDRAC